MNKFLVISISLKKVNTETFEEAVAVLRDILANECSMHIDVLDNKLLPPFDKKRFQKLADGTASDLTLRDGLAHLTKILCRHHGMPCVLLVDEYAPLSKANDRGYHDKMLFSLRELLSGGTKTNEHVQFAFLTGFLPLAKESAQSGLDNPDCCGPDCYGMDTSVYASLFDFTQSEVDDMLASAGLEAKRDIIREWYDGYRIGKREKIYCPWSIMRYLRHVRSETDEAPAGYWARISGNELLKAFMDNVPPSIQDNMAVLIEGKTIPVYLNTSFTYDEVYQNYDNFLSLLYLELYLTTTTYQITYTIPPAGITILAIPNKEVHQVFSIQIKPWI